MIRRASYCSAVLLGAMLLSGPAVAQQVSGGEFLLRHMAKGMGGLEVGDWVTYQVFGGLEKRTSFWRVAVVGQDHDVQGRPAYWVEVEGGQHHSMKAPLVQARLLITPQAPEGQPAISRMYFGFGMEKVREVSQESLVRLLSKPEDPAAPEKLADQAQEKPASAAARANMIIRSLPEKRLMTLAGTVTAVPTEVRYGSTLIKRIWMSREVPILHLAKLEIPAIDHAIEVREYGRNAKPRMILPVAGSPTIDLESGFESVMRPVELDQGGNDAP